MTTAATTDPLSLLRDRLVTTFDLEDFAEEVASFIFETLKPAVESCRVLVFKEGAWHEQAALPPSNAESDEPTLLEPIRSDDVLVADRRVTVSLAPSDQSLAMVLQLDMVKAPIDKSILDQIDATAVVVRRHAQALQIVLGVRRDQQEDMTALLSELEERRKRDVALIARTTELEAKEAMLGSDLIQAATLQRAMLGEPPTLTGGAVTVCYLPLEQVGGDLYDVFALERNVCRILVADATGHGVTAALLTMFIKSEYTSIRAHAADPATALMRLNLRSLAAGTEIRFTAACIDVDLLARTAVCSLGAHPAPCIVRGAATQAPADIDAPIGTFLGFHAKAEYENTHVTLAPSDSLFVYTDGIVDAVDAKGARLPEDFAARLFGSIATSSSSTTSLESVVEASGAKFVDDALIVHVKLT